MLSVYRTFSNIWLWFVSLYYQLSDIPAHFACLPRLAQRLRLSALVTGRVCHTQHPVPEGCQYIFLTPQLCVNTVRQNISL